MPRVTASSASISRTKKALPANYPTPSNTQSPPNTQQSSNSYLSSQDIEEPMFENSPSTQEMSGFVPSSPESVQKSKTDNINNPFSEVSTQDTQGEVITSDSVMPFEHSTAIQSSNNEDSALSRSITNLGDTNTPIDGIDQSAVNTKGIGHSKVNNYRDSGLQSLENLVSIENSGYEVDSQESCDDTPLGSVMYRSQISDSLIRQSQYYLGMSSLFSTIGFAHIEPDSDEEVVSTTSTPNTGIRHSVTENEADVDEVANPVDDNSGGPVSGLSPVPSDDEQISENISYDDDHSEIVNNDKILQDNNTNEYIKKHDLRARNSVLTAGAPLVIRPARKSKSIPRSKSITKKTIIITKVTPKRRITKRKPALTRKKNNDPEWRPEGDESNSDAPSDHDNVVMTIPTNILKSRRSAVKSIKKPTIISDSTPLKTSRPTRNVKPVIHTSSTTITTRGRKRALSLSKPAPSKKRSSSNNPRTTLVKNKSTPTKNIRARGTRDSTRVTRSNSKLHDESTSKVHSENILIESEEEEPILNSEPPVVAKDVDNIISNESKVSDIETEESVVHVEVPLVPSRPKRSTIKNLKSANGRRGRSRGRNRGIPDVNEALDSGIKNVIDDHDELRASKRVTRSSKNVTEQSQDHNSNIPSGRESPDIDLDEKLFVRVTRSSKNSGGRGRDVPNANKTSDTEEVESEGKKVSKVTTRGSKKVGGGRRQVRNSVRGIPSENEAANVEKESTTAIGSGKDQIKPKRSVKNSKISGVGRGKGRDHNDLPDVNDVLGNEIENTLANNRKSVKRKRINKSSGGIGGSRERGRGRNRDIPNVNDALVVDAENAIDKDKEPETSKRATRSSKSNKEQSDIPDVNEEPNIEVEGTEENGESDTSKARRVTRSSNIVDESRNRDSDVSYANEVSDIKIEDSENDKSLNNKRSTRSSKGVKDHVSDIPNVGEAMDVETENTVESKEPTVSLEPERITGSRASDIPSANEASDIETTIAVENDDESMVTPKPKRITRNVNSAGSSRRRGRNRGKGRIQSGNVVGSRTRSRYKIADAANETASENDTDSSVNAPSVNESEPNPEILETPDNIKRGRITRRPQVTSPIRNKGKTKSFDSEEETDEQPPAFDPDVVALTAENPAALQKAVRVLTGQNYDILGTPNDADDSSQNNEEVTPVTSLFIKPVNPISRSTSFTNNALPELQSESSFGQNTSWANDHWYQLKGFYEETKDEFAKDGKNSVGNEEAYRKVTSKFLSADVNNGIFGEENIRKRIIALEAAEHERRTGRRGSVESTNSRSSYTSVARYNSAYSNLRDTPVNKRKRSESNVTSSEAEDDDETLHPSQRLRTSDSPSVSGTNTPPIYLPANLALII
ncbi:1201_t:CDS:2 [Acaulospora colombiana]|uniref:1201_t:CDS:1 n=1 Tax=Acaulospora colombiana TaxID=27376 RepID=A0ACA9LSU9_9GLOM|nr:1201_t:CDS:2 [Acaulospora colombiana]